MNEYPNVMKEKLSFIINEMAESSSLFVKNPGKDFTRNRKLPFELVIQLLLSMGGNSIYKELLEAPTSAEARLSLRISLSTMLNRISNRSEVSFTGLGAAQQAGSVMPRITLSTCRGNHEFVIQPKVPVFVI